MRSKLLLPILLLAAIPAFAETVTVHLQLSDSIRAAVARGDIEKIIVGIDQASATADGTTAVLQNVDPGKGKLRAIVKTHDSYFATDGNPVEVVVKPGADITMPLDLLFVTGTATLHGKPFHGSVNVWPSVRVPRQSWGFAAGVDEQGKFAFPLPRAGAYDVTFNWNNRGQSVLVPGVEFKGTDTHVELPEGTIAGRVVDAEGKAIAGTKVFARVNASTEPRPFGLSMSDADGNFSIEGLPAGTWTLEVEKKPVQDVVLTDGAHKEGVLVRVGH